MLTVFHKQLTWCDCCFQLHLFSRIWGALKSNFIRYKNVKVVLGHISIFLCGLLAQGGSKAAPSIRLTAAAVAQHKAEQELLAAIPLLRKQVVKIRKDLVLGCLRDHSAWWQDVHGLMEQAQRMRFVLLGREVLQAWHGWTRWAKALGIEIIGINRARCVEVLLL